MTRLLHFINKMVNFKHQTKTNRIMQDESMVVVAEYNTVTEAEISKSILASSDIRSTIRNEFMSTIYPTGVVPAQLMVREEDLEEAQNLLRTR